MPADLPDGITVDQLELWNELIARGLPTDPDDKDSTIIWLVVETFRLKRLLRNGNQPTLDKLRQGLLQLSDTLDPAEGPVILAWSVDRLAERLFQVLRQSN